MKHHILALLFIGISHSAGLAAPPNIVFFLADDLGYGDVSCYGTKAVQTSAIDQLAREGVRFPSGDRNDRYCWVWVFRLRHYSPGSPIS